MKKFIISALILFAAVFIGLEKSYDLYINYSEPTQEEITVAVVVEEEYEHDPILDYDFSPRVFVIPPRYNPEGVVNPFIPVVKNKPKVVKQSTVVIPSTPLTNWTITQLNLTSTVVNHKFAYAFFTPPGGGKCYTGESGDYIGKKGIIISNITHSVVHLSDGNNITINR